MRLRQPKARQSTPQISGLQVIGGNFLLTSYPPEDAQSSSTMKRFLSASDLVIAAACAMIAAVSIIPFSIIAFIVFVLATFARTRSRIRSGHARFASATCVVSVFLFVGLVSVAAMYRPSKVVEQQLDREIALTSTRMTLAELSYAASYDRSSFPIHTSFCFAAADQDTVIAFPRRVLTIREFLDTIETQTVLRRRFMHCGNGYTVLGGGDCCFGLYVRDPELAVPPFPRDRFDVDAYAAVRDRRITK
jgi:hypothetical protein